MKKKNKNLNYSRRSFLASSGAAAVGIAISSKLPNNILAAEEKKLNFYNWDTYIGQNTIKDFKKDYGISVKMDLFATNQELFSKLQNGNPGYDLIVPSNDFVTKLINSDLIIPIDYSKIPNEKNLFKFFKDSEFDPGRKYSITYMWGTIGIGYNKQRVNSVPNSWKYLYNSSEYSGRIAVFGSTELLQIALKYLGYSVNDTNKSHLKETEELLIAQKEHIKAFHLDNGQDILLSNEVDIVQEYNGDIAQINEEDENMQYVVPNEGSIVWQDCLAIPKGAPHPNNAHKFINFMLSANAGVDIADEIQYATPNEAAFNLMDDSYTKNSLIFPSQAVLDKCESAIFRGVEHDQYLEQIYTRIRAA